MLTFKDLKDYDIKNLDVAQILKDLRQHKDILINVALVFTSIVLAMNIGNSHTQEIRQLKTKLDGLEKKVKAVTEYKKTEAELSSFLGASRRGILESEHIIDKINNFAIKHNIEIMAFTPSGSETKEFYQKATLRLELTASSYADIGRFISDIENSDYNFRIEQWSATSPQVAEQEFNNPEATEETPGQKPSSINVSMAVSSMDLKR